MGIITVAFLKWREFSFFAQKTRVKRHDATYYYIHSCCRCSSGSVVVVVFIAAFHRHHHHIIATRTRATTENRVQSALSARKRVSCRPVVYSSCFYYCFFFIIIPFSLPLFLLLLLLLNVRRSDVCPRRDAYTSSFRRAIGTLYYYYAKRRCVYGDCCRRVSAPPDRSW